MASDDLDNEEVVEDTNINTEGDVETKNNKKEKRKERKKTKAQRKGKSERKHSFKPILGLSIENAVSAVNDAEESLPRRHFQREKNKEGTEQTESAPRKGDLSYYNALGSKNVLKNIGNRGTLSALRKSVRKSTTPKSRGARSSRYSVPKVKKMSTYIEEEEQSDTSEDDTDRESETSDIEKFKVRRESIKIDVERENRKVPDVKADSRWRQLTGNLAIEKLSVSLFLGKQAQKHLMSGENYGIEFGGAGNNTVSIVRYEAYGNRTRRRNTSNPYEQRLFEELLSETPAYKYEITESDWPPAPPTVIPGPPPIEQKTKNKMIANISKAARKLKKNKRESFLPLEQEGFKYIVYRDVPLVVPPPPEPHSPPLDGTDEGKRAREAEMLAMSCEDLLIKVQMAEEKNKILNDEIRSAEKKIKESDAAIAKLIPGSESLIEEGQKTSTIFSDITGKVYEVEKLGRK